MQPQEKNCFSAIAFYHLRFYTNQAFFRRSDLTTQNKYNQRDESSLLAANIQLDVSATGTTNIQRYLHTPEMNRRQVSDALSCPHLLAAH